MCDVSVRTRDLLDLYVSVLDVDVSSHHGVVLSDEMTYIGALQRMGAPA